MGIINAFDGLRSLVTGMGQVGATKRDSTSFAPTHIDPAELRAAYQSSWMAEKIVDIPVEDALRKKRHWQAAPDQLTKIEAEESRLGIYGKLDQVMKLARRDGYAAIYIAVGDEDPMEPLDPERIKAGGLISVAVLTRSQCTPGELEDDIEDARFGTPRYWRIGTGATQADVHPSRLAIFTGKPALDPFGTSEQVGVSALEAPWQAIKDAESTIGNIAELVFKSTVDIYKIPDLGAKLSTKDGERAVLDRLSLANLSMSVSKAIAMDTEEEFAREGASFSNLPDVLREMMQIAAGAANIPLTRFLGTSPGGLNTNGDGDMDVYYDRIQAMQELDIRPAMALLDECMIRSALGNRPDELFYVWPPLRQLDDKTRAEVAKIVTDAATALITAGVFTQDELRKAVVSELGQVGFFGGLETELEDDFTKPVEPEDDAES